MGIWVLDQEGNKLISNKMTDEIWGGLIYENPADLGNFKARWNDSGEVISANQWAAIKALRGETHLNQTLDIVNFDGTHKTILDSGMPIIKNKDDIAGAIIINVDVTQQKECEKKLKQVQSELEKYKQKSK